MEHTRRQLNSGRSTQEDNPEVLKEKIHRTRVEIAETVNTLQARLSPERIKEEMKTAGRQNLDSAKAYARWKAGEWQTKTAEKIRNNPLPAAMVGIGLVWLFKEASCAARGDHRRDQNYYSLDPYEEWPDYAPERAEGRIPHMRSRPQSSLGRLKTKAEVSSQDAREQISQWTDQARGSLEEWKSSTAFRTQQIRSRMRERGVRAKGEFSRHLQESPLTIGAMTLAMGVAIGLSLPRTQKEDLWLGKVRDRLFDEAKATAKELMPKAKEVAGRLEGSLRVAVEEESGATGK